MSFFPSIYLFEVCFIVIHEHVLCESSVGASWSTLVITKYVHIVLGPKQDLENVCH